MLALYLMCVPFEIKNSSELRSLRRRIAKTGQGFAKILGFKVNAH